jgi:ATP synthase protein I
MAEKPREIEEFEEPADDLNPLFHDPPDPGPIPEVLRHPVSGPEPAPPSNGSETLASVGVGWGMAIDFLVTIFAGLAVGWAVDHWARSGPWGLVTGMGLGLAAAMIRMIRATQRAERSEAEARRRGASQGR